MIIIDKTPDELLVNVDSLKSAITEDRSQSKSLKEKEKSANALWGLAGSLISCFLTLGSSWGDLQPWVKIVIVILTSIFSLAFLWFFVRLLHAHKELKNTEEKDLDKYLIDEAKKKIRYTALLIICYQKSKTGEVKFMTEKQRNYLIHCDMDPHKSPEDQKEGIMNFLAASYDIPKHQIKNISPLSEEPFFSIKPIHGPETQNGFIFFQISLKEQVKQSLMNHRNVEWKSIQEMEGMPELMGRNQDIIMALHEYKTKITDSFEEPYGPIHVIWNITKECPYACEICATRDDSRPELSTEEKLQVLNHIFSAKDHISTLDFAGGDPMYCNGTRTIISQAINSLGEERVSVTTTGKGIQAMEDISDEDTAKLLKKCEITIDASHENLTQGAKISIFSRSTPEYCRHNFAQIKNAAENLQYLMINIPLLDDDLNDTEINHLIQQLTELKSDYSELQIETQLIRLMPVGAFNNSDAYSRKYTSYQPIEMAKKLKSLIENIGISCRYHCSLRVLPDIGACDKRCHMLDKKVGIDCSGNVFACTWGAYLRTPNNDITQNPFYLGNLVSSNLKDIIMGQGHKTPAYKRISRNISNQTERTYCEAISWFFQNTIDENHDPLAK